MCNKCDNTHSSFIKIHHTIKLNKDEEIFTGYCKEKNHPNKLEYFCKDHNKLCWPAWKGKYIKIKYVTQLPTRTPQFAFFCNLPQWVKDPYKRFLENKLREHFDFEGCPIQVYTRAK